MTDAPDTNEERLAEYRRLFAQALAGREKTAEGIRFRFRAAPGVEACVRDLAAREKACCAFYAFAVTVAGDEVLWDCAVPNDDTARAILDEFYALPDTLAARPDAGMDSLRERFAGHGLAIISDPADTVHTVHTVVPDTHEIPPDAPIVCTIRPGDDEQAIMAAYRGLFAEEVFVSGERTNWGVRWTFRDQEDVEQQVRTQAAFEQRCCAFLRMAITVTDGVVVWDVIGPANAGVFLDEYAQLPQTAFGSVEALRDRTVATGLVLNDQR